MLNLLFAFFFPLSVLSTLVYIGESKEWKFMKNKALGIAARVFTAVAVWIALIDVVMNFGTFDNVFLLMGFLCLAEFMLCRARNKYAYILIPFAMKAVFWTVILELTLFNAPSYKLFFGNYPEKSFTADQFILGEDFAVDENGVITLGEEKEFVAEFTDLGFPVGTVSVDVTFADGAKYMSMVLDAKDATQRNDYRYDIAKTYVVVRRPRSSVMPCYLSGDVSAARVKFVVQNKATATISAVTFNKPIPFGISIVRLLFFIAGSCFIFAVMHCRILQRPVSESDPFFNRMWKIITAVVCIAAFVVVNSEVGGNFALSCNSGNQVSQELVDAFEAGQTHLLNEPSEVLAQIANPYDKNLRESTPNHGTRWDHVYFDGKYYSYYGIMPVLVLFLPYHELTGKYFSTPVAILLFSLIGIIGLSMVFLEFVRKFFPKLPTGCYLTCLIILHVISGIWFSVGRLKFYEVAMSAGFAFLTWAVYFFLSANIIGEGKISLIRSAAASLIFGAAVLSRPTLVLYCLCAGLFMTLAVKKASGKENKLFTWRSFEYIVCFLTPMVCLGVLQMLYNYDRFGNPFEFGIQYSLTINDFTNSEFHSFFSFTALYNYLFNPPVFTTEYPFVSTTEQWLGGGGFFHIDIVPSGNTSGLFFLALPMFAYLLARKAVKLLPDRRQKILSLLYIGLPCIIIPVGIISSVWESGYAVRYMVDFSWEMVIGAMAVIFFFYCRTDDKRNRRLIRGFLCFSLMWALVVGGIQNFNQAYRFTSYHYDCPQAAYDLEQLVAFWR